MQFDLFPPPPLDTKADAELARKRPENFFIGTSSWTFRGWSGIVYRGNPSQEHLTQFGLEEYAKHPLFNTAGIDRSFYAPLSVDDFAAYAKQLPSGFRCAMKVWNAITNPASPQYLDAAFFKDAVLAPADKAFAGHLGPLLFQLPPLSPQQVPGAADFAFRLDRFFSKLPPGLECAVEVRNSELMTAQYFTALKRNNVSHVFNHWEKTPSLTAQMSLPGALTASHVVTRLMLPQGIGYETAREAFAPFDRIQARDDTMRAEVAELWRRCVSTNRSLWVLVGNKAEGCSPLTVRGVLERIVAPG
ncbi:MAG: DUF72 domain-containing protein [Archangium sp.]